MQMMPQGATFTTRPQLAGTFGMVASTHWLASAAGMAVLEQGGNAFDAAVAAGLVLQVVEPHMCGPAGEVPVIGFDARDGEAFVLNGQGPAPGAATIEAFGELGLDLIPGNGLLAASVPAAFGTWMLLLAAHGSLPLREVMRYAIGYARDGYPVVPGVSSAIGAMADLSPGTGQAQRRSTCPGACRLRAFVLQILPWPAPTRGFSTRRRRQVAAERPRSRRRGGPSTRGSWPRRSAATSRTHR